MTFKARFIQTLLRLRHTSRTKARSLIAYIEVPRSEIRQVYVMGHYSVRRRVFKMKVYLFYMLMSNSSCNNNV